jgi:hypothetical protein
MSLGCVLFLTACSGVGIDPTEDPVQPSNSAENAGAENSSNNANFANEEANAGANENLGNNVGFNEQGGNQGENFADEAGGDQGQGMNNAADENFLNGNSQGNMFANEQGGNNNLLNNNKNGGNKNAGNNNLGLGNTNENLGPLEESGDDALVNGAETDLLAPQAPNIEQGAIDVPVPEDTILAPVAETPTDSVAPKAGGVVRYVLPGGSKLHDRPSGQTMKNLEQGDHPLVSEEGEWARTSDGYYVPTATLTAQPIGRLKVPREWR